MPVRGCLLCGVPDDDIFSVRLLHVARSTEMGNAKALYGGMSNKFSPRFFYYSYIDFWG